MERYERQVLCYFVSFRVMLLLAMLRTRHPASDAVLDLREALEKTQPELAMMVGASRTSVARWETSHPPRGETLLRLAKFAKQQAIGKHGPTVGESLGKVEIAFMSLYFDEILENVGGEILADPRTGKGYLLTKLENSEQVSAAMKFLLSKSKGRK